MNGEQLELQFTAKGADKVASDIEKVASASNLAGKSVDALVAHLLTVGPTSEKTGSSLNSLLSSIQATAATADVTSTSLTTLQRELQTLGASNVNALERAVSSMTKLGEEATRYGVIMASNIEKRFVDIDKELAMHVAGLDHIMDLEAEEAAAHLQWFEQKRSEIQGTYDFWEKKLIEVRDLEQANFDMSKVTLENLSAEHRRYFSEVEQMYKQQYKERDAAFKEEQNQIKQLSAAWAAYNNEKEAAARAELNAQNQINQAWEQREKLQRESLALSERQIEEGYKAAAALRVQQTPVMAKGQTFIANDIVSRSKPGYSPSAEELEGEMAVQKEAMLQDARAIRLMSEEEIQQKRLAYAIEQTAKAKKMYADAASNTAKLVATAAQLQMKAEKAALREAEAAQKKLAAEAARATRAALGGRGFGGGGLIGPAVNTLIGIQVIKQIAEMSDHYTTLRNRIALVTETEQQREAATKRLVGLAVETRTSLDATAQIYQRLATSAGGLNLSYDGLLRISTTLNKAVVVGGSNFVEAEKGLLQFSQGMSRGVLRGDELRSVLEQLPGVADILAEHFGVARGGLYAFGEAGKITSKEVIAAMQEAEKRTAEAFEKTIPTISQSFGILQTKIIEFLGTSQNMKDATSGIAVVLTEFAKNLDNVSRALAAGALYYGLLKVFDILSKIALVATTGGGGGLATVLGKSGLLFALTRFTFGDTSKSLHELFDSAKELSDWADKNSDSLRSIFVFLAGTATAAGLAALAINIDKITIAVKGLTSAMAGLGNTSVVSFIIANPMFAAVAGGVALTFGSAAMLLDQYSEQRKKRAEAETTRQRALKGLGPLGYDDPALTMEDDPLNAIIKGTSTNIDPNANKRHRKGFEEYLQDLKDRNEALRVEGERHMEIAGIMDMRIKLGRKLTTDEEARLRVVLAEKRAIVDENELKNLRQDTARRKTMAGLYGDAATIQAGLFSFADRTGRTDEEMFNNKFLSGQVGGELLSAAKAERARKAIDDLRVSTIELAQQQATLNELRASGTITLEEYTRATQQLQLQALSKNTDAESGFKRGILQMQLELSDVAKSTESLLTNAFNSAGDALASFVTTGKLNFSSLIDSMISDLAKLAVQQMILRPLIGAVSGYFNPAPESSLESLPSDYASIRRASGGPVYGPGTSNSDSIRALLSNGEHVIRADVAEQPGMRATLNTLNATGDLPSPRALVVKSPASSGPIEQPAPVFHIYTPAGTQAKVERSRGLGGGDQFRIFVQQVANEIMDQSYQGGGVAPYMETMVGRRTPGMQG